MSPILDSIGSVKAFGWGAAVSGSGSFDSIETYVVGSGGQAQIEFASIPQSYLHLQIRGIAQQTTATTANCIIRYNDDSGSNYNSHFYGTNGSTASAGYFQSTSTSGVYAFDSSHNSYQSYSGFIIDIFDYSNTNKNTTNRTITGWTNNASGENLSFIGGMWRDTSAVTNIKLLDYSGGSFRQYSHFALYGIKGQ